MLGHQTPVPLDMEECGSLGLLALNRSSVVSGAPYLWDSTRAFLPDFQEYFSFSFSYPFERCRTNGSSAQVSLQF